LTDLYLGVDLGTTAVKALLVSVSGEIVSSASADNPVHGPGPSMQEQDFSEVWASTVLAVRECIKNIDVSRIKAMALSAAMHGMMPLDNDKQPLRRMMTWADGRAFDEAKLLREKAGSDIYKRTGSPATALYFPARALWLRKNEPEIFKKTAWFSSIRDRVIMKLSGRLVTDRSHASSNGLLNIHDLDWDPFALELAGIDPEKLPPLVEPDEPVGGLLPETAKELGLPEGTIIASGAGDGGLANLGSGAIEPGQAAATIGTSGAMRKITREPNIHPEEKSWCYYLGEKRWYSGGAINSGGIILRWLRDGWLSDVKAEAESKGVDPYELIIELAEKAPPGCEGLTFLPYLYGERTPYWNPDARGVIFGLSPSHGREHLSRATLEGICMSMAHVFECIDDGSIKEIRATGGFTGSRFWLQLLSDVLGLPVAVPEKGEGGSALGAAVMAMKAAGAVESLSAATGIAPVKSVYRPDMKNHDIYRERMKLFKKLYKDLEKNF